MINIEKVCKNYGDKTVINQVSLEVAEGQTLALLGTSGSGKTTLLKMINYLIPPSSGNIYIAGQDNSKIDVANLRKRIGYVIQQVGLFPHYTIRENIELVLKLEGHSQEDRQNRSDELLRLVGLDASVGERYPSELSGGQQQRVGIARAMANDPPLMLLDAHYGALDPITKQALSGELLNKQLFKEKTVVLVTHDVFEAITLADTICLLDAGEIQQIGTPKQLLFSPCSTFVKNFFDGQRFRLELQVTTLAEICPFISSSIDTKNPNLSHSMEQSVWELLEQIEDRQLAGVTINGDEINTKSSTPEALILAFYDFKKSEFS
ncbi:MAG: ATP-binding cassette domain-containing protein [Cyclobacteriaceae bacterium]